MALFRRLLLNQGNALWLFAARSFNVNSITGINTIQQGNVLLEAIRIKEELFTNQKLSTVDKSNLLIEVATKSPEVAREIELRIWKRIMLNTCKSRKIELALSLNDSFQKLYPNDLNKQSEIARFLFLLPYFINLSRNFELEIHNYEKRLFMITPKLLEPVHEIAIKKILSKFLVSEIQFPILFYKCIEFFVLGQRDNKLYTAFLSYAFEMNWFSRKGSKYYLNWIIQEDPYKSVDLLGKLICFPDFLTYLKIDEQFGGLEPVLSTIINKLYLLRKPETAFNLSESVFLSNKSDSAIFFSHIRAIFFSLQHKKKFESIVSLYKVLSLDLKKSLGFICQLGLIWVIVADCFPKETFETGLFYNGFGDLISFELLPCDVWIGTMQLLTKNQFGSTAYEIFQYLVTKNYFRIYNCDTVFLNNENLFDIDSKIQEYLDVSSHSDQGSKNFIINNSHLYVPVDSDFLTQFENPCKRVFSGINVAFLKKEISLLLQMFKDSMIPKMSHDIFKSFFLNSGFIVDLNVILNYLPLIEEKGGIDTALSILCNYYSGKLICRENTVVVEDPDISKEDLDTSSEKRAFALFVRYAIMRPDHSGLAEIFQAGDKNEIRYTDLVLKSFELSQDQTLRGMPRRTINVAKTFNHSAEKSDVLVYDVELDDDRKLIDTMLKSRVENSIASLAQFNPESNRVVRLPAFSNENLSYYYDLCSIFSNMRHYTVVIELASQMLDNYKVLDKSPFFAKLLVLSYSSLLLCQSKVSLNMASKIINHVNITSQLHRRLSSNLFRFILRFLVSSSICDPQSHFYGESDFFVTRSYYLKDVEKILKASTDCSVSERWPSLKSLENVFSNNEIQILIVAMLEGYASSCLLSSDTVLLNHSSFEIFPVTDFLDFYAKYQDVLLNVSPSLLERTLEILCWQGRFDIVAKCSIFSSVKFDSLLAKYFTMHGKFSDSLAIINSLVPNSDLVEVLKRLEDGSTNITVVSKEDASWKQNVWETLILLAIFGNRSVAKFLLNKALHSGKQLSIRFLVQCIHVLNFSVVNSLDYNFSVLFHSFSTKFLRDFQLADNVGVRDVAEIVFEFSLLNVTGNNGITGIYSDYEVFIGQVMSFYTLIDDNDRALAVYETYLNESNHVSSYTFSRLSALCGDSSESMLDRLETNAPFSVREVQHYSSSPKASSLSESYPNLRQAIQTYNKFKHVF